MVITKGPLLSLSTSGTLGKAITYSNCNGQSYVKKYAKPTNNKQLAQLGLRAALTFQAKQWSLLSAVRRASWDAAAADQLISPFNAYQSKNLGRFATDLAPTQTPAATPAAFDPAFPYFGISATDRNTWITTWADATPLAWSITIYRSHVGGFTPSPTNAIHMVFADVLPTYIQIADVPPYRGIWYYRQRFGDAAGNSKLNPLQEGVMW